jgi:uncharacterized membrane protein YgaE (UPF0421/DUF939 family)
MAKTGKLTSATILHGVRTTFAAVFSMFLARWLGLPEFYWAPISAIVIIESTINPRTVAWQRFVGTALGAMLGGLIATFFSSNALVYAIAIFASGVLCAVLRLRGAHRFAAITVSIILRSHISIAPGAWRRTALWKFPWALRWRLRWRCSGLSAFRILGRGCQ